MNSKVLTLELVAQKFNNLKYKENIFNNLITEKHYDTENITQIKLGNIKSKNIITIITNPLCNGCILAHEKINYLRRYNKDLCIQFIFSDLGHGSSLQSTKFLAAAYIKGGEEIASKLFDDWYLDHNNNRVSLFSFPEYQIAEKYMMDEHVAAELSKHSEWVRANKINSTPIILLNGYLFPKDYYEITDLNLVL
ncbi:thioredoxin domain-containing protein [Dysgonomonas sp. Marseille-P4677]|uniref:thioredoxin domain-containing protein n=1 Tax=Dysgonomonas sp. Marseille-P4677 TaxID=2364790 RepID=UPI001914A546|nr:thioredoxin domain-containing protein [Dysgonomonas sp. Marseille-P4677]MBK5722894.1 thioredoxin domain-containing protein [Dysgonomonas sp. Marseille-P4677]